MADYIAVLRLNSGKNTRNIHNCARFVVDAHYRHKNCVFVNIFKHIFLVNCAVLTGHNTDNIKAVILKLFRRFHNTAVFNGRHNNPPASAFFSLGNAENCKIVCLCTAAYEINFIGSCTEPSGNLFSSLYKLLLGIHSTQMK